MAKREVDIKVKYIPDTSALKSALSSAQKIDFKIGGSGLKKELLAPVQNAMREVNKALASGADNKTLLKLFQDVGKAADAARVKANGMLAEINSGFNSAGNQKLLTDLEKYQKELDKVEKKISNWDSKYGNKTMSQMKNDLGVSGIGDAKKQTAELEEQVKLGKTLTQQELDRLDALKKYVNTWNERKELADKGITKGGYESEAGVLRGKISDIMSTVELPKTNVEWTKQLTPIITALGQAAGLSTQEINRLTTAIGQEDKAAKDAANENKKEALKLADVVTGTFLGTSVSSMFESALRRGVEFFKEYDETLTRTMMVTGMTRDEVNNLTSSYNKLANQLSSTTKDVAAAQLVFYQQGLGTSEALKMTEASIAISKTGGIEAGEAANRLTAAVRGYKLAANDAMDIADKMSALDAAAASSVDELTIAMQKSASQARMAGLDLDYYMAYLSTMQEVTREAPENIGTAMKSITSRLQEITDIGKVEEDGTTFSNVAKALNSVGIAAVDSTGQLRSLQDVMNDLGPMWATLDKNHKAYLATVLAGNRQQSRFIALMDNYDRALELVSVSQNSTGNTAKQLRAYNQGLEASFKRLDDAWEQFATRMANSDTIKGVIDLLTNFVEILNKIPKPITQTIIPLIALSKGLQILSNAGTLFGQAKTSISKMLRLDEVTKDVKSMNNVLGSGMNVISKFGQAIKRAFDGFGNNKYIEESTNKIKDFTIAEKAATAAQTNSNPTQVTEAGLNNNIALSAEGAANAYKVYNEELFRNAEALAGNDAGQTNEIKQNLENMTSDILDVDKELEDINKQRDKLYDRLKGKKDRNISEELVNASPNKRRSEAERYLRSKSGADSSETLQDLLANNKKNTQKLTKDTQKDLLNFSIDNHSDIVRFLEDENNSAIEQMGKALDDLEEKRKKLFETRQNKISELEQYKTTIESSPIYQRALSKYNLDQVNQKNTISLPDMKNILGDKNLGNIEKFGAFANKLNIGAGLVSGSIAKMGASFLGLDEDMSSTLGTTVGLATTFGKFAPPWGAIIGASLGIVKGIFDAMWPSVEKTKEKLVEYQQEADKISQERNDIESNLQVYEELSGKLDKTEEETQRLKDSTEKLSELIPGMVIGYNDYGEAIINTAKAYEELDKKQKELSGNADKQLSAFTDLQKGAQKTEKTVKTIFDVLGWITAIATAPITYGSSLVVMAGIDYGWSKKISNEQIEENRKVFEENFSEIQKAYQTKRDAFLLEVQEDNKDTASKVLDSLINGIMDAGAKGQIPDYQLPINQLLDNVKDIDWSILDKAKQHLETSLQYDEKTFGEARSKIDSEIREELKRADLEDIQIDAIITAVLNITYTGAANAENLKKQIDTVIEDLEKNGLTDDEKTEKANLEAMKGDIDNLTQSELELLSNTGLLRTEFATLFKTAGGMDELLNKYVDENGQLNKNKAIVGTINDLIEERKKNLESINSLTDYNNQKQLEYENKLKGIAQSEADRIVNVSDEERAKIAEQKYKELKERVEKIYSDTGIKDSRNILRGNSQYNFNSFDSSTGKYDSISPGGKFIEDDKLKKAYNAFLEYNSATSASNNEITKLNNSTKIFGSTLENLSSLLESYKEPTFGEMSQALKDIESSFNSIKDLIDSIDESGGKMSFGDMGDLFSILDGYEKMLDTTNMASASTQSYYDALGKINNALSVQNGYMTAQEGLEEGLYQLAIASAQAKMEAFYIQLEQTEAELSYQNAILATEKAAVDAALEELRTKREKANITQALNNTENTLEVELAKVSVDTEVSKLNARLEAASEFGVKYAKIMREAEAGTYKGGTAKISVDTNAIKQQIVDSINTSVKNMVDLSNIDDSILQLEARSEGLQKQIDKNNLAISDSIDLKKKVAEYLKDPKNIGNTAQVQGIKDASNAQKDYNEKLERTLTLLEKIEGLQHKIDENETFKDLYKEYDGESYGRLLMSNLDLAQQQYEVYKDLFDMQQQMTNQAAGNLLDSPYGQMFKIMENGDIGWADASMYDKYKNLPDDMQEDIDNLVEAFQKQRDALRDTEQDLSKYAQEIKKVREELVEMEIYIENELVNAIKNREKILHDARMKALDDEIAMIDEAVERRQKARETENQNKELYQAQEALRRATLDSSGKNNASLLQLQQDLEDKQLEISEKRFEQDMEDRKNWLQDTKDAETETYEYRLETMTWYWEEVQAIQEAGTEAMMQALITWNEEYRTQSALQQEEMERKWRETMDAMRAATDMGAELGKLTSDIKTVTQTVEAMDIQIQKLPGTWQKATNAANSYAAAARAAASYGSIASSTKQTTPKETQKKRRTIGSSTLYNEVAGPPKPGDNIVLQSAHMCPMPNQEVDTSKKYTFSGQTYYKIKGTNGFVKESETKAYARGGMVDYTGPAWVDGTKSHPEAFLSAYQTEQIGALAGALDSNTVNNVSGDSNITFGSISFNVASMSSAADGRKALDIFVQGANNLMAKKGVNTKINLNIK